MIFKMKLRMGKRQKQQQNRKSYHHRTGKIIRHQMIMKMEGLLKENDETAQITQLFSKSRSRKSRKTKKKPKKTMSKNSSDPCLANLINSQGHREISQSNSAKRYSKNHSNRQR